HELSHIANRDVLVMTIASFFAMLAGLLTRFGLYAGMFGGGRDRDNNSVPVWLIVLLVSVVTYFLSQILILAISRYREFAADRGSALITGAPEHLFALTPAAVTMQTELGLRTAGAAGICFKPLSAGEFVRAENDLQQLLDSVAAESGSKLERREDKFGYTWIVVRDAQLEDQVTTIHAVGQGLEEQGFGGQLLAAVFKFEGGKSPVYWIYGFKRGTFWPFVPTGEEQERDNAQELELKAKLEPELPVEQDLSRWFGVFDSPL